MIGSASPSEMMNPLKPHSPLIRSFISQSWVAQGYSIQRIVSHHNRCCSSFLETCFKSGEINFTQQSLAKMHRRTKPPFHSHVGSKMLGCGYDAFFFKYLNIGNSHAGGQVWIFPKGFPRSSPAGIPCYINHGSKYLADAAGPDFFGNSLRNPCHQTCIP